MGDQLSRPRLARRATAAIKEFEGGVLMISHNEEFFGPICPERWVIPGDTTVTVTGAEWMEAVKAKELEAKKNASKLQLEKEKKFDAFGNEISEKNGPPDEMLDLELEIDEAKKQVDKLKAMEKAEQEKAKAAAKPASAKKADDKKASKPAPK